MDSTKIWPRSSKPFAMKKKTFQQIAKCSALYSISISGLLAHIKGTILLKLHRRICIFSIATFYPESTVFNVLCRPHPVMTFLKICVCSITCRLVVLQTCPCVRLESFIPKYADLLSTAAALLRSLPFSPNFHDDLVIVNYSYPVD